MSDSDRESDIVYENDIYNDDGDFMDADKTDGTYYIGLAGYVKGQREPILMSAISPVAFMANVHYDILDYLVEYSTSRVSRPRLDILQVRIDDRQTYNVCIKTHWLRLVQRKWKNIYMQRRKKLD
jgi:hypothetical protein